MCNAVFHHPARDYAFRPSRDPSRPSRHRPATTVQPLTKSDQSSYPSIISESSRRISARLEVHCGLVTCGWNEGKPYGAVGGT